jgi:hypothetical protein
MFKRRFRWVGPILSDEGFSLAYGNRSVTYRDARGAFEFGLEDGCLCVPPHPTSTNSLPLSPAELDGVVQRIMDGLAWDGHLVRVITRSTQ